MLSFHFDSVRIESYAIHLPPSRVTSLQLEDVLAPQYDRLAIARGTLERLTGVQSRYFWGDDVTPSNVATIAAQTALDQIGFDPSNVKALFNCSITRDFFEPATACIVHHSLGLSECALVFDITNACIGFMNGLVLLANLIESRVIPAGIVVSGETNSRPVHMCMEHILKSKELTREGLLKLLPTLTLGSGAVAYVLCHESIASNGHRLVGGVGRAGSQFHDLCSGNGDFCFQQPADNDPIMTTSAKELISSAAQVGGRTWTEASAALGWSNADIDHVFCHQVGKPINDAFYREIGVDNSKEFTIYEEFGNQTSAALPIAVGRGVEALQIHAGEKLLLLGFGSGINSLFAGVEW
ncbi:MAG: 3-oxoacyl-ACP synthase III [Planctomycetes bacterium]|nr:3-oxoacyl-ACP synthase III [Planctomycetota bacterium]MBI3844630.1 3-oxoacyl-ACP synthase III [Planctomycetota bacterium]